MTDANISKNSNSTDGLWSLTMAIAYLTFSEIFESENVWPQLCDGRYGTPAEVDAALHRTWNEQLWPLARDGQVEIWGHLEGKGRTEPAPLRKIAKKKLKGHRLWSHPGPGQVGRPQDYLLAAKDNAPSQGKITPGDEYWHSLELASRYRGVSVLRREILALSAKPLKTSAKQRSNSERLCQAWLDEQIKLSPLDQTKPRDQWKEGALMLFHGLTHRAFLRAWDKALFNNPNSAWGRAGRPKKIDTQNRNTN